MCWKRNAWKTSLRKHNLSHLRQVMRHNYCYDWAQVCNRQQANWSEGGGHGGVNKAEGRDQIEAKGRADGAACPEGGADETDGSLGGAGGAHVGLGGSVPRVKLGLDWVQRPDLVLKQILGLNSAQDQRLELDLAPEWILELDSA